MRTVVEKYQRLAQIQEKYAEKIKILAQQQLAIDKKIIQEFKLVGYEYDSTLRYDYLKVGDDGEVELWDNGRCGDSDEYLSQIRISDLIIAGDLEGYEKRARTIYNAKANQAAQAKEKEKETRRQTLQKELDRINVEMGKLS